MATHGHGGLFPLRALALSNHGLLNVVLRLASVSKRGSASAAILQQRWLFRKEALRRNHTIREALLDNIHPPRFTVTCRTVAFRVWHIGAALMAAIYIRIHIRLLGLWSSLF